MTGLPTDLMVGVVGFRQAGELTDCVPDAVVTCGLFGVVSCKKRQNKAAIGCFLPYSCHERSAVKHDASMKVHECNLVNRKLHSTQQFTKMLFTVTLVWTYLGSRNSLTKINLF